MEVTSARCPSKANRGMFDTDRMVELLHQVIKDVASRGNCVIVGRGSPYILRNRPDAFHVFVYAPVEEKIRRIMSLGKSEKEAAIGGGSGRRARRISSATISATSGPAARSTT